MSLIIERSGLFLYNGKGEVNKMKISLVEPLNVRKEVIEALSEKLIKEGHTFVSYDTLSKDEEELKKKMQGQRHCHDSQSSFFCICH